MSRTRFPLLAKVILWFCLNLLILAAAFLFLFRGELKFGLDALLTGPAGDRVHGIAQILNDEFDTLPRQDWGKALQRFSAPYHVKFILVRHDGTLLAGDPITVPTNIVERMNKRPLRPPAGAQPPPEERDGFGPPPEDGPPNFDRPPPRPMNIGPQNHPPFVVHTVHPSLYWIGVSLPVRGRAGQRPVPTSLLIVSNSLRAGGLLFDFPFWISLVGGSLLFSLLFWVPLVGGITRSISQMKHAALEMADGNFDLRVNETRRDELGSLGGAINRMSSRLDGFVQGQKRFLGDIAHELCSPIARIQMGVGILEQRAEPSQKKYIDDLHDEVQQMSRLVNELLSFSKASLGVAAPRLQTVLLRPIVERAIHREEQEGVSIEMNVPESLAAVGDPELLVRAISNLIRNAICYAREYGPIVVSARSLDDGVEIAVSDRGQGVPESEIPKLFDPFYRVDTSRDRTTGGVGLGLSIVKTCIEACRGSVACQNLQPAGFSVVIRLARPALEVQ